MPIVKKAIFLLCIALLPRVIMAQSHLHTQRVLSPILKMNLVGPFYGSLSFQYEDPIDKHTSNQYGLFIFTGQLLGITIPVKGFGLTYDYRFYLKYENQSGSYIQPYFRYQYFNANIPNSLASTSFNNRDINVGVYGTGLVIGKQWILYDKLVFDMYIGPMYNISSNNANVNQRELRPIFSGLWYRAGITVGFKFK